MMNVSPDAIGRAAVAAYASLPKRGKPQGKEWTVLAAFVAVEAPRAEGGGGAAAANALRYRCVALATGSKCCGRGRYCGAGTVLRDSHAECLAQLALFPPGRVALRGDAAVLEALEALAEVQHTCS